MPPAKNPGGRPRAEEGQPPFPKVWKDTERLAGVLAYLEASEKGPNANREGDAKKAYADQLDFVITEVKEGAESLARQRAVYPLSTLCGHRQRGG